MLIISPWNYPVNLTLVPLVGAIAAGKKRVPGPFPFQPNSPVQREPQRPTCFRAL